MIVKTMSIVDPTTLAQLKARIWALEHGSGAPPPVLALGAPDAALPWGGLPLARLHQIAAADPSALGFVAALLGLAARGRPVLWCRRKDSAQPFLPGLAMFGLKPEQGVIAEADRSITLLWAMEEGLRSASLGGVLAEADALPPAAARRLQLAAETGGVTGIAVTPAHIAVNGATTRWRIGAAPSAATAWGGLGQPTWRAALERSRGAPPREWVLTWNGAELIDHPHPTPLPLAGEGGTQC